MMNKLSELLIHFETHSVEGIRQAFYDGADPNQMHKGKPLVYALINMYLRSPRFNDCMRVFVESGLAFEDEVLLAVLLDDAAMLGTAIANNKHWKEKRYSLQCTFTPLEEASLLHICAEYNHVTCARLLIAQGLDVNTVAGVDEYGFGGHTPIFHTVNQHNNNSLDIMELLLEHSADLSRTVKGLSWGRGYSWETFIPSVNPLSYAIMGLLPQFQRKEKDVYFIVQRLLRARYGLEYEVPNVPNSYLRT